MSDNTIRIYLADLAAYNEGILKGGWIDCNGMTADEILEDAEQKGFLGRNRYNPEELNEWAIHDHEGLGPFYSEFLSLSTVAVLAEKADELNDEWSAYCAYCGNVGELGEGADIEDFRDAYHGHYDTFRDFAEETFDEQYLESIPEYVRPFIDYDAYARDLGHAYFEERADDGGVWVFSH